jgi:TolB-like protein
VTLAVGPFRGAGDAGAWVGPALRDGINTQLSELSGVRVFSDEFMDFVMNREGLSTIELATRLGIEKMVSGTVVVVGDDVRVEARIVDIATGLFEGAYVASGRQADFLALESELVMGVIGKLGLQLTAEDEERLAAQRAIDLDARRRLFRLEGEERPRQPAAPAPADPESGLWDMLGPARAHAGDAEAEVTEFLEQYRRATEAGDIAALASMYVAFSPGQRAVLEEYYASVRDLRVRIDRLEAAVVGEEAVVNYTRSDSFLDVPTQRRLRVSARVTKTLRRVDGEWKFTR